MSSDIYLILERLAAAVVRAFYDDELVVVIDMLIRHRQVRDNDLGPRLGLATKQVRKAMQRLQAERLVDSEKASDDDQGHASIYWFINYRRLVGAVTWRLHRMRQLLEERERKEQQRQNYTCPQCNDGFTSLEVQRLVNAGRGFCCCHCCPYDTHQQCGLEGPLSYALKESVFQTGMDKAKRDLERFKEQLSHSRERDGVFDLLQQLKEITEEGNLEIPSNLPSENFRQGIGSGQPFPQQADGGVDEGGSRKRAGGRARLRMPNDQALHRAMPQRNASGTTIEVEIRREDSLELAAEDDYMSRYIRGKKREREEEEERNKREATKKQKALPNFLGTSRISGPTSQPLSLKEQALPDTVEVRNPHSAQSTSDKNNMDFQLEYQRQMANFTDGQHGQTDSMEIEVKVDCMAESSGSESSLEEDDEECYGIQWNPGCIGIDAEMFPGVEMAESLHINYDAVVEVGEKPQMKRIGDVTEADIEKMTTDQYIFYYNYCSDTVQLES